MSLLILATTLAMAGQHDLADLAKARFDAASKLYDTAWNNYREKRVSTGFVNFTSVRLLRAELELSDKKDTQITAYEHHLSRVKKTQDLAAKVAALGAPTPWKPTKPATIEPKRSIGWRTHVLLEKPRRQSQVRNAYRRASGSGPGGPRVLLPWGSRRSVLALSRIQLLIS